MASMFIHRRLCQRTEAKMEDVKAATSIIMVVIVEETTGEDTTTLEVS